MIKNFNLNSTGETENGDTDIDYQIDSNVVELTLSNLFTYLKYPSDTLKPGTKLTQA